MSTLRSKLKVPMAIWFCTIMQPGHLSWPAVSLPNGSPMSGFVYFHMLLDRPSMPRGISLRNMRRTHSEAR
jgi:hypothetical protein